MDSNNLNLRLFRYAHLVYTLTKQRWPCVTAHLWFILTKCHRIQVTQSHNWHCQLLSTACPSTCDNVTSLYSWIIPHLVANSRLAGQEITRLVWNPKVYYRILKGPPLGPSDSMSVQSAPSNPLPSDFNIALRSTPSAPKLCLPPAPVFRPVSCMQ
jgi:hypothetical protein